MHSLCQVTQVPSEWSIPYYVATRVLVLLFFRHGPGPDRPAFSLVAWSRGVGPPNELAATWADCRFPQSMNACVALVALLCLLGGASSVEGTLAIFLAYYCGPGVALGRHIALRGSVVLGPGGCCLAVGKLSTCRRVVVWHRPTLNAFLVAFALQVAPELCLCEGTRLGQWQWPQCFKLERCCESCVEL